MAQSAAPEPPSDPLLRVADMPDAERAALREMFQGSPLNAMLALEIVELGPAHALVSMPVAADALNHAGTLHGGAIATLIDQTCGTIAARAGGLDYTTHTLVTADLHVRYLARTRGAAVHARAEVVRAGRQLIIVDCAVTDDTGTLVATADFSSMIVPKRAR
ncbi:PaaI family thioesterase [Actinomadura parmotrematis]|uniref:PaaI family thioesterase n=1 Tax=Actinomadura parmotrematis TaxID=2864039 RepID=A0ABS7FNM9_9ACTN|nr:PaaI family thioesterase [Actinomadura parmotrematis]MBW8481197.1 PaaI family thioesterase [Actinomadura parmotrematis]